MLIDIINKRDFLLKCLQELIDFLHSEFHITKNYKFQG